MNSIEKLLTKKLDKSLRATTFILVVFFIREHLQNLNFKFKNLKRMLYGKMISN
jgi:hypothetical protein